MRGRLNIERVDNERERERGLPPVEAPGKREDHQHEEHMRVAFVT